jgi:pimeloyl-ACP methyl ester carboxylesterase
MGLYVEEHGPADAPSIVLLHGGGGAGWMWRPQVEALRDDYHVIVPDLPEQGRSCDAGPFTMQSASTQVADLIRERAHGGRAHVVGLSEGAQVGVQLLADAPEVVETAVLSSPLVRPLPGGSMMTPGVLRLAYRTSMAPLRDAKWWVRLNMRSAAGVPDEYFDDFHESFRTLSESGFVDLMVANGAFRLPSGLGKATARTLVLAGEHEYAAMRGSVADVAAALPNGEARLVHHASKMSIAQEHNWNMTAPELFNATVRAWIEGADLPAELVPA